MTTTLIGYRNFWKCQLRMRPRARAQSGLRPLHAKVAGFLFAHTPLKAIASVRLVGQRSRPFHVHIQLIVHVLAGACMRLHALAPVVARASERARA